MQTRAVMNKKKSGRGRVIVEEKKMLASASPNTINGLRIKHDTKNRNTFSALCFQNGTKHPGRREYRSRTRQRR